MPDSTQGGTVPAGVAHGPRGGMPRSPKARKSLIPGVRSADLLRPIRHGLLRASFIPPICLSRRAAYAP
ncbi:MAG TPA: hypothetical protein VGP82_13520 [Ktedonobacterales bacterium]|nr:hypothetical protein [Ktedonobacterales bacterium]